MMAHYKWTPAEVKQMTPAQIVNAWAAWKVTQRETEQSMLWTTRIGSSNDQTAYKRAMRELET